MKVVPLPLHSPRAMREALAARGWSEADASLTAEGAAPAAYRIEGLSDESLQALVHFSGGLGLDVVSGDGWALVAGSRSRLSALARPWTVPEPLRELAVSLGLAMPGEPAVEWRTARGSIPLTRPVVMGVVNVTPDSFSDGGLAGDPSAALRHAERLVNDGADLLDVGGESTRPGRQETVTVEEELRRVVPVVQALAREFAATPISVDTMKVAVAEASLEVGAAIINDVSGLRYDGEMAALLSASGAGVVLMHSRGGPLELASTELAVYDDVIGSVADEMREMLSGAMAGGVAPDTIVLDPGIGFAKTGEQNILVADQLSAFLSLGRPLLIGPSRKRFLGTITGRDVAQRDTATAAACALAWERGARIFRVHDVAGARDALAVAHAFGGSHSTP